MNTNKYINRLAPMIALFFIFLLSCQKSSSSFDSTTISGFDSVPVSKPISPGLIDEASGIADSKANAGYLWVEQDSGNPNDIFLLSYNGTVFKKVNIKSAINRDWEDMTIANGPATGTNYIYLADIGDNNQLESNYFIYRFPEPVAATDTISVYDKINFQYADGSHDAEAILVDNSTKDIYIITKRDAQSKIYKLTYPQSTTTINTAIYLGALNFTGVVSAAFSVNGNEIILKTYTSLYYWKKNTGQTIEQVLQTTPTNLGYQLEPQGEAICFKNDNSGFYTLSERPFFAASVALNFYKRK